MGWTQMGGTWSLPPYRRRYRARVYVVNAEPAGPVAADLKQGRVGGAAVLGGE